MRDSGIGHNMKLLTFVVYNKETRLLDLSRRKSLWRRRKRPWQWGHLTYSKLEATITLFDGRSSLSKVTTLFFFGLVTHTCSHLDIRQVEKIWISYASWYDGRQQLHPPIKNTRWYKV